MFSTANPFAVLDNKRFKGDPTKLTQPRDNLTAKKKVGTTETPKKDEGKKKPAAETKSAVDDAPVRKSKVLSLKEEAPAPVPEAPKAVVDPPPPTKKEREAKDRHEDRSAKGDRERKGGRGKGGWEDNLEKQQELAEKVARGEDQSPMSDDEGKKEEKVEEAPPKEPAPEPEKPTYSLAEHLERQKKIEPTKYNVRQVDESQVKNLQKLQKQDGEYFTVKKASPKPAAKAAPAGKQAAAKAPAKGAAAAQKKDKEEEKEKKEDTAPLELGFYHAEHQRGRGGRDGGRREGGGRGGRGGRRGYEGGERQYNSNSQSQSEAKPTFDESHFPSLTPTQQ